MKLFIDHNLAPSLVERLTEEYPGSVHAIHVGLECSDDRTIWSYAREHGFAIVSKDSDFHQMSVREGPPPKVVWVRLGNCAVDDIEAMLRTHRKELEEFAAGRQSFFVLGIVP